MKFQASNKLKSFQISFVYLILTPVGTRMSNPNKPPVAVILTVNLTISEN